MPFPANPSVGDTYVENNNTYKYLGPVNGWYRTEVRPSNDTTYIGSDGAPGGSSGSTQVIFNNNGAFAGDVGLTYNSTTDALTSGSFIPTSSTVPVNGVYLSAANTLALATNSAPKITISSIGRIGIGTTSPSAKMEVVDTNTIVKSSATSGYASFYANAATGNGVYYFLAVNNTETARIQSDSSNTMIFGTGSAGTERARIDSSSRLLIGTPTNVGGSLFQVNDNRIRIATAKTPASATDTGATGEICWDANYIYVCTATNTWKRSAIATW